MARRYVVCSTVSFIYAVFSLSSYLYYVDRLVTTKQTFTFRFFFFLSLWFFKYIWNTIRGAFDLIKFLIFFCHRIYISVFLLVRGKLLESLGKEILAFLLFFSLYFLNTSEILPKRLRIILTYQICLPTLVVFLVLFGYSLGVVTCDILCTKGILTIFTVNFGSVLRKFMNCCLSPLDVPSFLQLNLLPCYF